MILRELVLSNLRGQEPSGDSLFHPDGRGLEKAYALVLVHQAIIDRSSLDLLPTVELLVREEVS